MAKRRQDRYFEGFVDCLVTMPAWVGPMMAAGAWLMIRYGVPVAALRVGAPVAVVEFFNGFAPIFSWCALALVLFAWGYAECVKFVDRQHLNRLRGVNNVDQFICFRQKKSELKFEQLVAEAYRQQGYAAEIVGLRAGDAGVDIRLTHEGTLILVQCKHWQTPKVRLSVVRKLLRVVTSMHADGGILVTSGSFTPDAWQFAQDHPVELVDGQALNRLLSGVIEAMRQKEHVNDDRVKKQIYEIDRQQDTAPMCPKCGLPMVLRLARNGALLGRRFWGCPRYPDCQTIVPYNLAQRRESERTNPK